ncbi:MAG: TonB-dependent receptor plug domain-containing protein, partial [Caulobacterales bacterium]|nr:TonB-dependent receptor plug domain-containing protein [Caulobacterales bacterium]
MPGSSLRFRWTHGAAVGALSCAAAVAAADIAVAQEQIMVTATRRAESIQDVPVSVVGIGGEQLQSQGVTDVAQLTTFVPGLEFASNSLQTNLYIRGIGSGASHSIEQSVGRFVDDVYVGRADMNLHGFFDVASVEVLRGPQSTLFGKNTAAGAIIVRTGEPTSELAGGARARVGRYSTVNGYKEAEGFISGPLADNVRGRLALRWRDDGGYVENLRPGPDSLERRDLNARFKGEWDIGADTVAKVRAEYSIYDADGQVLSEINFPSPLGPDIDALWTSQIPTALELDWRNFIDCEREDIVINPYGDGDDVNTGTFCPFRDQDSSTLALTLDHTFEGVGTLTSVTAYQSYDWDEFFVSVDQGLGGGAFRAERAESFEAITQEFRFTSEQFERFDYILGFYYEDSEVD